jgi:hypothetical protein
MCRVAFWLILAIFAEDARAEPDRYVALEMAGRQVSVLGAYDAPAECEHAMESRRKAIPGRFYGCQPLSNVRTVVSHIFGPKAAEGIK